MAARAATMNDEERISDSGGSSAEPNESEELGEPESPHEETDDPADIKKPNDVAGRDPVVREDAGWIDSDQISFSDDDDSTPAHPNPKQVTHTRVRHQMGWASPRDQEMGTQGGKNAPSKDAKVTESEISNAGASGKTLTTMPMWPE